MTLFCITHTENDYLIGTEWQLFSQTFSHWLVGLLTLRVSASLITGLEATERLAKEKNSIILHQSSRSILIAEVQQKFQVSVTRESHMSWLPFQESHHHGETHPGQVLITALHFPLLWSSHLLFQKLLIGSPDTDEKYQSMHIKMIVQKEATNRALFLKCNFFKQGYDNFLDF